MSHATAAVAAALLLAPLGAGLTLPLETGGTGLAPVPAVAAPGDAAGTSPGPAHQPDDRPDSCDGVAEPAGPGVYEGTVEGADRDYFQLAVDGGDRTTVAVTLSPAAGRPAVAVEQFEPIVTLRRGPNALSAGELGVRPADPAQPAVFTLVGEEAGVVCFVIRDTRPANATGAWNWTLRLREAAPTPTPTRTRTRTRTPAATATTENVTLAPREGDGRQTPGFGAAPALAAVLGVLVAGVVVRRRFRG